MKIDYCGVNHLAFATGDLERTIRYWRDLLCMRLLFTAGWKDYKIYFFGISPGSLVGFFEWPGVQPVEEKEHGVPRKGPFAFDHVSIGLRSEDDVYALKDRLNAAGEWVSEVTDHGFIHSIYTFDPNGIPLEFSSLVEGVDISIEPVLADSEPPPSCGGG
jgi:catechol 2,3-dioxygenase-like lactoylglutathione lyase family enzyme